MTWEEHIHEARRLYEKEHPNTRLLVCHLAVSENFVRDRNIKDTLPDFVADEIAVAAKLATKKLMEEVHGS